jgi:pentatricopeptide repeat protein
VLSLLRVDKARLAYCVVCKLHPLPDAATLTTKSHSPPLSAPQRHNSTQQREIVERNAAAGLPPTLVTYTMLMSRLLLEGRRDKAEAVMREMEAAGLEPDHRSHAVFTDPTLGRKRWAEMRRLRKLGEAGAAEAAEIWERVQATGEAEAPQVRSKPTTLFALHWWLCMFAASHVARMASVVTLTSTRNPTPKPP